MEQPLINSLHWMVGPWIGRLGTDTVTESWSEPLNGCMDTSIRLAGPDSVRMLELIVIEQITSSEGGQSLELHLRQFGPTLDLVTHQDLFLERIAEKQVSFTDASDSSIRGVSYELLESTDMQVSVTTSNGEILTAILTRP